MKIKSIAKRSIYFIIILGFSHFILACNTIKVDDHSVQIDPVLPGANDLTSYIPMLRAKNIGVVISGSSKIDELHLIDSLLSLGIQVVRLFPIEKAYRGSEFIGEANHGIVDNKSGARLVEFYNDETPTTDDLIGLDFMVFDIQDLGVISDMYIDALKTTMEICALSNLPLLILDRPNPNGHIIDGPIFNNVGLKYNHVMHIPLIYGMTIAEYALMLNGEKLLRNSLQCDLHIVKCLNYNHNSNIELQNNLSLAYPNSVAINLYPTLKYFNATDLSIGLGTDLSYQVIGHPDFREFNFSFTPTSRLGAPFPIHENTQCYGLDLRTSEIKKLEFLKIDLIVDMYKKSDSLGITFFKDIENFDILAGSPKLRFQLLDGLGAEQIRNSWKESTIDFMRIRKKYLLYD